MELPLAPQAVHKVPPAFVFLLVHSFLFHLSHLQTRNANNQLGQNLQKNQRQPAHHLTELNSTLETPPVTNPGARRPNNQNSTFLGKKKNKNVFLLSTEGPGHLPYLVRERTPVTEELVECPEPPAAPGSQRGFRQ